MADAYRVFKDGLESGDTSTWSRTIPSPPLRIPVPMPGNRLRRDFRVDLRLLRQTTLDPLEILAGLAPDGQAVFTLEARLEKSGWQLRARARHNDGTWAVTEWCDLESGSRLQLEWSQALPVTTDGHVYVSLDNDLALWLVDLDNHRHRLAELSLMQVESRPVLQPLVN